MKSPNIIEYNKKRWYKKIIPYKYKTRPFFGYHGSYISYDSGKKEVLVEVVELSEWLVEKSLREYINRFKIF